MLELIIFILVVAGIVKLFEILSGDKQTKASQGVEQGSALQQEIDRLELENFDLKNRLQQEKQHRTQVDQSIQESRETLEMEKLRQDVIRAQSKQQQAESELAAARKELEKERKTAKSPGGPDLKELVHQSADSRIGSIKQARAQIAELYATTWYLSRVDITPRAIRELESFDDYKKPGELVRAVQAVLEAGAQHYEGTLGTDFRNFFGARGFGFSSSPKPHLKVDDGKSPDQVLRIYWTAKEGDGRMKISWIGRHP